MARKCLISKGRIDKYIFLALGAGIFECILIILIFKFTSEEKHNKHPLIMGFNAGLGMSLSIVPFLIGKIKSHRERKRDKLQEVKSLTKEEKNLIGLIDLTYFEKYDKKKLRTQKFLILLACAFLDFLQKFMTFFLNKLVICNIWIFNIIFISIFDCLILKTKFYKHQYISFVIIVLLGIGVTVVGFLKDNDKAGIKLSICIGIKIIYSLAIVLSKFLMDHRSCTPVEVTFYEGIFALIINSILLGTFSFIPLRDEDKDINILFELTEYGGKIYIDHFLVAFKSMNINDIIFFILSTLNHLFTNLFGHMVVNHFTSSHIIIYLIIGEFGLVLGKEQGWHEIVQFSLLCVALFVLLIFTEIIEINAYSLEKDTKKNIELREKLEEDDFIFYDLNGNIPHKKSNASGKVEIDGVEIDFKSNTRSSDCTNSSRSKKSTLSNKSIQIGKNSSFSFENNKNNKK